MTSDSDDALTWDGDEGAPPVRPSPNVPVPKAPVPKVPAESAALQSPDVAGEKDRSSRAVVAGDAGDVLNENENENEVEDHEREPLSTAMLLIAGVIGGVYLLYSIGWVIGGLRLRPLAGFFVTDAMFLPWFVLAAAAPALWFLASWLLTRGRASWVRICALLLGVVLLVPWPFVTVGVIGS